MEINTPAESSSASSGVRHPENLETPESRVSFRAWISLLAILGSICMVVTIFLSFKLQGDLLESRSWVLHTHDVLNELNTVETVLLDAESSTRGYFITKDPSFLLPYTDASTKIGAHLDNLQYLVRDNSVQLSSIARLRPVIADKLRVLRDIISLPRQSSSFPNVQFAVAERGRRDMEQIKLLLSNMKEAEHRLLVKRTDDLRNRTNAFHILLTVLAGTSVVVLSLLVWLLLAFFQENRRWQDMRLAYEKEEQQRQFRDLFDSMPQLAWTARPDGFVDFFNKGWYDYTGTTYGETQGWGWSKVHDPEQLPDVLSRWRFSIATGTPFEMAFRLRRSDGVFRWFLTRVNPILDPRGNIIRWVGINTDIDEQTLELQSALERQRTSEQRLSFALDAADIAVWELDWSTGNVWRSPLHDRILGYERPLAHFTYKAFLEHVLEDDRTRVSTIIQQSLATGSFGLECRIKRADGAIRWIEAHGKCSTDKRTGRAQITGTVTDITERKEESLVKEYLATLVDSSQDAVYTKTLDGTITSWNRGAESLYGYSAEEIIGRSINLLVPPDRTDEMQSILSRIARDEKIRPFETKRITKTGKTLDVSLSISPVKDEEGHVVRACMIARDIGPLKSAQEELLRTKEFLESLFEHAPDAIVVVDSQGVLCSANALAAEMFGYTVDELIGKPIESLMPDRLRKGHVIHRAHYMDNPQSRPMGSGLPLFGLRQDGSEFPVDINLSPIQTTTGPNVMAVVRDLTEQKRLETERKQLEDAVKAQDASLRNPKIEPRLVESCMKISRVCALTVLIFSALVAVGCVFNIDVLRNPTPWGRLIPMNAALCMFAAATGILAASSKRRPAKYVVLICGALLVAITTVTTAEWIFGWDAGIDQLIVPELHMRFSTVPGRMPTSAASGLLFAGLSLLGLVGNRPRFSQLCAFGTFCIGLITMTGHMYDFPSLVSFGAGSNIAFPAAIVMTLIGIALMVVHPELGFTSIFVSPSLGGKVMRRLVPIILVIPFFGTLHSSGQHGPELLILMITINVFLPVAMWFVAKTIDRLDRQKDQALDRAFARREELELSARELAEARDQALQASNLKSAFVANISHELRTPLSGIIGNTEMLLGAGALAADQKHELETTLACSYSLLQIVNDLLDLSKIESGKFGLECLSFEPATVVHGVMHTLNDSARQKGLSLTVQIAEGLPAAVMGDRGRLRQVLLNIVNNAIKFTPSGEVSVRMSGHQMPGSDEWCFRFEVHDTGVGISEENQALLFKPFSQVDSSVTRKYGGAGLGLSLCKNLVDLMGGIIGLRSTPGSGSMFWIEIPFQIMPPVELPAQITATVEPEIDFSGKVVLLVEDNAVVQKLVMKQLASLGVTALAASNGKTALEMVSPSPSRFDLILMDCNLPDLSGLEVTREIRKTEVASCHHTPIVAMTAAAMKGDKERCIEAGMDGYLSKPVSIAKLKETLIEWLAPPANQASSDPNTLAGIG